MVGMEYAFVSVLMLAVFPFSMVQMGTSLDEADLESFSLWVLISSLLASIPFMLIVLPARLGWDFLG